MNKWIECCVSGGICKVLPTWANNRHNVAGERAIEVDQCVLVPNGFRFLKTHKKRSQKQSSPVQSISNTNLPIISAHDALMHTRSPETSGYSSVRKSELLNTEALSVGCCYMANAISINFTVIFSFTNRTNMYRSAIYGIIVISIILTFYLIQKSIPNRPNRRRERWREKSNLLL